MPWTSWIVYILIPINYMKVKQLHKKGENDKFSLVNVQHVGI